MRLKCRIQRKAGRMKTLGWACVESAVVVSKNTVLRHKPLCQGKTNRMAKANAATPIRRIQAEKAASSDGCCVSACMLPVGQDIGSPSMYAITAATDTKKLCAEGAGICFIEKGG